MDIRDVAAQGNPYKENHHRMVIVIEVENVDGEDAERSIPAHYEVCRVCDGRGAHVSAGVDAHGLSGEDFADDPDFADDYVSGRYDVTCTGCGGRRVELVANEDDADLTSIVDGHHDDIAEREAERRAGC